MHDLVADAVARANADLPESVRVRRFVLLHKQLDADDEELTRTRKVRRGTINARYGETFTVPQGVYPEEGARVKNLQEPERLMSTSAGNPQGVVRIVDEPDVIRKKFKSAVTDSGREVVRGPEKAGISNLIEILAAARGESPEAVEKEFSNASGYAEFKAAVGEAVAAYLAPVRERYGEIRSDHRALEAILAEGAEKARAISSKTVALARERMGVGPPRH